MGAGGGAVRTALDQTEVARCGAAAVGPQVTPALIRAQTAVLGSTVRLKFSGLCFLSTAASQLVPVTFDYAGRRAHAGTATRVDDGRVNSQSVAASEPAQSWRERHVSVLRSSHLGHCGAAVFEQRSSRTLLEH